MLVNSQPLYRLSYWGTYFQGLNFHPVINLPMQISGENFFRRFIIQERAIVNLN
jgi:hypothetical protein